LQGQRVQIRRRGSDGRVVYDVFVHEFHLPPPDVVPRAAALIFDLGANIGLTMAQFACKFPHAAIVGVELDANNADCCRTNISRWGDRCQVIQGAVWTEDGSVSYEYDEDCQCGLAVDAKPHAPGPATRTAEAFSLNTLVRRHARDWIIDYLKMDIEGAEREVLRQHTEWAGKVRCIKAEVHGEYSRAECLADLAALGFETREDPNFPYCAIGIRPSISAS
jgi:FkbM family methyltransferase